MTSNQLITIVTALQFYEESGRIDSEEYQQLLEELTKTFTPD